MASLPMRLLRTIAAVEVTSFDQCVFGCSAREETAMALRHMAPCRDETLLGPSRLPENRSIFAGNALRFQGPAHDFVHDDIVQPDYT